MPAALHRFNPRDIRCAMELDNINPESWRKLLAAAQEYCEQPSTAASFDELCRILTSQDASSSGSAGRGSAYARVVTLGAGRTAAGGVEVVQDSSPR